MPGMPGGDGKHVERRLDATQRGEEFNMLRATAAELSPRDTMATARDQLHQDVRGAVTWDGRSEDQSNHERNRRRLIEAAEKYAEATHPEGWGNLPSRGMGEAYGDLGPAEDALRKAVRSGDSDKIAEAALDLARVRETYRSALASEQLLINGHDRPNPREEEPTP